MTSENMVDVEEESTVIVTHTPSSPFSTPRSGRKKKKGALARLAERKKRAESGVSDVESNYGSAVSLQTDQDRNESLALFDGLRITKGNSSVTDNDVQAGQSTSNVSLNKPAVKPRLTRNRRISDDDVIKSPSDTNNRTRMLVDEFDSSSSALQKFRALKMTPSRSSSTESLKNSRFSPRPPTTPRRTPPVTPKGEKRIRETNSSGEDQEKEGPKGLKTKRQILLQNQESTEETLTVSRIPTELMDSSSVIPDVCQPVDSSIGSRVYTNIIVEDSSGKLYPSLNDDANVTSDGRKISALTTASQFDLGSMSHLDIGSTSDLQSLSDHYKAVLAKDTLPPHSGRSTNSAVYRTGRLTPLSPRHPPPALAMDSSSGSLKTTNKTDKTYRTPKFLTGKEGFVGGFDTMSQSLASSSALPLVTIKEAKTRSYLLGSINNNSALLGAEELDRYFPDRKLHIFVGSWNMADLKECSTSLDEFILPDSSEYVQDVYVIGTQENSTNKKEWEVRIQETLGPSHVLFHSACHGALHLAVFIRRDLIWFCSVPDSDIVTTRAFTMVKTKGAVAVSFTFFGTSLLFINSHFTSDDSKVKNRIGDYKKIIRELNLPKASTTTSPKAKGNSDDITQKYDAVFWCGDLNFRIDRHRDHVEDMLVFVTSQLYPNFESLIASDQLTKCISDGQIFLGFQEGRIGFKPTYKFDLNSDVYDTSHKLRIPSYTDRVLFRSKKKNGTSCVIYDAAMSVKASDHRPVFGLFETSLRPGRDTIPLAAGLFDRNVYIEANKRRAMHRAAQPQNHKSSSVCNLQ